MSDDKTTQIESIELEAESARAYDKECNGCLRFNSDVMVSFSKDINGKPTFFDFFLSQDAAIALHEELGQRIKDNKTIAKA